MNFKQWLSLFYFCFSILYGTYCFMKDDFVIGLVMLFTAYLAVEVFSLETQRIRNKRFNEWLYDVTNNQTD